MDWNAAIERHRDSLKRILATLVAMAGLSVRPHPEVRADPELVEGEPRRTLPRHLHRAVLRLLRPAEAAARRLIIAQARGLVVALKARRQTAMAQPSQAAKPKPLLAPKALRNSATVPASRPLGLPLLDPLRRPFRRRRPVRTGMPRISVPGFSVPFPIAPSPSPDDPVNAARLGRRLAALAVVLDDLPGQAMRFACWQARLDASRSEINELAAAKKGQKNLRFRRIWPLRPGRPPGSRRRPIHEVDDVLKAAHGLAFLALQRVDTS